MDSDADTPNEAHWKGPDPDWHKSPYWHGLVLRARWHSHPLDYVTTKVGWLSSVVCVRRGKQVVKAQIPTSLAMHGALLRVLFAMKVNTSLVAPAVYGSITQMIRWLRAASAQRDAAAQWHN